MPLDAITISALTRELAGVITDAKIDRVQQPERDELVLSLRTRQGNRRLVISAGSTCRMHFTETTRENPASPPMFCMLLRKHLQGGRITAVTQTPMERVVTLTVEAADELGDEAHRSLIVELMGGRSNIILVDSDGRIIDCLKRVSPDSPEKRRVLPGLFYRLPDGQDKIDPRGITEAEIMDMLAACDQDRTLDSWLLKSFMGLSPLVCRELAYVLTGDTEPRLFTLDEVRRAAIARSLSDFFSALEASAFEPYMLLRDGEPFDFSYIPLTQYGQAMELRRMESFSSLLEEFYTRRAKAENMRIRSRELTKRITGARDRLIRKLALQREELKDSLDRERWRELGDILSANLWSLRKGMSCCRLTDLYSPELEEIEIRLDPLKTPQQNAARYYKEYNKRKTAERYLTAEIAKAETELEYLGSVLEELSKAENASELTAIREELTTTGYIRDTGSKRRMKTPAVKPLSFVSESGFAITVGRNNLQNDELTLRRAYKSDIWLHTQKIHGSHVIISADGREVDEATLYDAACIAAWYSQARGSSNIPVDYTLVKYVKKPSGSRPGMVIYTEQRTLYVTPDEQRIESLKKNK